MKKILAHIILHYLISSAIIAQQQEKPRFQFQNISGYVSLNGVYNNSILNNELDHDNYNIGGSIGLSTTSYFWHPNFARFNFSGSYSPQQGEVISNIMPDYFTDTTAKTASLNANFFQSLNYNINAYLEYSDKVFLDRFVEKDIEDFKKGLKINYDGLIDFESLFEHRKTNELNKLVNKNRDYTNSFAKFKIEKTIKNGIENRVTLNIQKIENNQNQRYNNTNQSYNKTNKIFNLRFLNKFFIDKKNNSPIFSSFILNKTTGDFHSRNFIIQEKMLLSFSKNLKLISDWSKNNFKRGSSNSIKTTYSNQLNYAIYSSLKFNINLRTTIDDNKEEYSRKQSANIFGVNYNKSIPFLNGSLQTNYIITTGNVNNNAIDEIANIYDESHQLLLNNLTYLRNPNVITSSIIVRDITRSVIYEENIDYIVLSYGNFTEIQLLLGGNIVEGEQVLIDYQTLNILSYNYDEESSEFNINLNMFNNFVNLSYKNSHQNFHLNSGNVDNVALNKYKFNQYSLGHFNKIFNVGVSYTERKGDLFPIRLWDYRLNMNYTIGRKIRANLSTGIKDYFLYFKEGDKNQLIDFSSLINYSINYNSRILIALNYSKQIGVVQNFDLVSGRVQVQKNINQLELHLGLNLFEREYGHFSYHDRYVGLTFKLKRNF